MKKMIISMLALCMIVSSAGCGNQSKSLELNDVQKVVAKLMLPNREDVISAVVSCGDETEIITDGEKIDDLFNELSSITMKSGESYDDTPTTEDYLKIVFETFEGLSSDIVYIFRDESEFFVEQPYHGIFSIDGTKYSAICSILMLNDVDE